MYTYPILEHIHNLDDLKTLNYDEIKKLASEIREVIVRTVAQNGGHLASNLGVVELTIALHRIFNSPEDKIVWDVGHQCYTHKILTGRYAVFSTLRTKGGLCGFPNRKESVHDVFDTGHASTSVSSALGLLAGAQLSGKQSRAVAVIGDGALTGGLAYEALSHAGQLGLPLIVILNDNKMSISPNVGALSKYLSRLSMKSHYQFLRRILDSTIRKVPFIGKYCFDLLLRIKRAIKAIIYTDNFFVDLGFEYVGPIDGHNTKGLEDVLYDVRKLDHPVVVHVLTQKGKGYTLAEDDPGTYHGVGAFSVDGGVSPPDQKKAFFFTDAFSQILLSYAANDERIIVITAAMEKGTGLSVFHKLFPKRFFDVGIAEEHAVTFAAGLAASGRRPVVALYSTFIQRSVDQVIHDVALQELPVIFAIDRAGFVSDDGKTHQGLFDIALFRSVPSLTILAPANASELDCMFRWIFSQTDPGPVIIRYPKALCPDAPPACSQALEKGRGVFVRQTNASLCIAFTGGLFRQAVDASTRINADLYNIRFIKPVDEEYLAALMNRYNTVIFVEEGVKAGGFGEYAAELALRLNCSARIIVLGVQDNYVGQGKREELLAANGLDGQSIARAVYSEVTKYSLP
ncbi:MAG: 1-deoxy-D-xylulose-5-phosphate synthase [Spirochaetaceae bacterium]|jgi:1-deoxy-D-xylulose-5-phosphate synthase|nr:1-deoxy-D-xylulose-5-phosphate synthase [Spirochaetaceae bacterium]